MPSCKARAAHNFAFTLPEESQVGSIKMHLGPMMGHTWYMCARRSRILPSPLSFSVSRYTLGGRPLWSCRKLVCPYTSCDASPDLLAARPNSGIRGSLTRCCRVRLYVAAVSEPCMQMKWLSWSCSETAWSPAFMLSKGAGSAVLLNGAVRSQWTGTNCLSMVVS